MTNKGIHDNCALMTQEDVAQCLKVQPNTVRDWRVKTSKTNKQVGPVWVMMNKRVRYKPKDVQNYIDSLSGDEQ